MVPILLPIIGGGVLLTIARNAWGMADASDEPMAFISGSDLLSALKSAKIDECAYSDPINDESKLLRLREHIARTILESYTNKEGVSEGPHTFAALSDSQKAYAVQQTAALLAKFIKSGVTVLSLFTGKVDKGRFVASCAIDFIFSDRTATTNVTFDLEIEELDGIIEAAEKQPAGAGNCIAAAPVAEAPRPAIADTTQGVTGVGAELRPDKKAVISWTPISDTTGLTTYRIVITSPSGLIETFDSDSSPAISTKTYTIPGRYSATVTPIFNGSTEGPRSTPAYFEVKPANNGGAAPIRDRASGAPAAKPAELPAEEHKPAPVREERKEPEPAPPPAAPKEQTFCEKNPEDPTCNF